MPYAPEMNSTVNTTDLVGAVPFLEMFTREATISSVLKLCLEQRMFLPSLISFVRISDKN